MSSALRFLSLAVILSLGLAPLDYSQTQSKSPIQNTAAISELAASLNRAASEAGQGQFLASWKGISLTVR